jgi:hypothetical protein
MKSAGEKALDEVQGTDDSSKSVRNAGKSQAPCYPSRAVVVVKKAVRNAG